MENEKYVIEKITNMDVSYESLKPKVKDYLCQIETYIRKIDASKKTALNTIKTDYLNVATIAKELNLSRTTFYNNSILKDFIEYSAKHSDIENPYQTIENLRTAKALLQDQVDKMISRDVDIEQMKHEKQVLEEKIESNKKEIERLHKRVNELAAENNKLKKQSNVRLSEKYN